MLTEQQQEQRSHFVGSSDIGAIIGVDLNRNAGDVWLAKTGRLPRVEANTQMNRGIAMEPFILDMFEMEYKVQLARDVWVQHDDVCAANLDGALIREVEVGTAKGGYPEIEAPVEAKSSNFGKDWNQETGDVPLLVLVQTSFQILCAGPQCTHGFTPALVPEHKRFKFVSPVPIVKRNDEFLEELKVAAHEFWEYVRLDKRPPDSVPHLESLKRMKREPNMVLSLGDEAAELWSQYEAAGQREKSANRDRDEYKTQILAMLGDAEAGRLLDGREITFLSQNSPRHCDVDRLHVLNPELYEQVVSQGTHRVLRIKKAPAIGRKAR
jgi:predicted phage-related endonuclease